MSNIKIYNKTTINNFGMAYRYTVNLKDRTESPEYECMCEYNTSLEYEKLAF